MTPEKKVQNDIVNYLNMLKEKGYPVYVERRQAGGFSYKKGQADLYAVINGQHIEIEVKQKHGHQDVMQEKWESKCKTLNIVYILSNDIMDFKEKLKETTGISSD